MKTSLTILAIVVLSIQGCFSVIYVSNSPKAKDDVWCGDAPSRPCRTLENAISLRDPTIRLIGSSTKAEVFEIRNTLQLTHDVEITATMDTKIRPIIRLVPNLIGVHSIFAAMNTSLSAASGKVKLSLNYLSFEGITVLHFGYNAILHINDCYFSNVISNVIDGSFERLSLADIYIEKSTFQNCESIVNVLPYSLKSDFNSNLNFSFVINNSNVTATPTTTKTLATSATSYNGIFISITNPINFFTLRIMNTIFSHLRQAVRVVTKQEQNHINFEIFNSKFFHNSLIIEKLISKKIDQHCPGCVITCGAALKYAGSGNLRVTNAIFHDNTANEGGAVCLSGPTATFYNTKFYKNKAIESGGACYVSSSMVAFHNANFTFNSASLRNRASGNKQKLDSTGYGGAIRSIGDVTVTNSMFIHNNAYVFGGSVCHDGEKLNLSGNVFAGPQVYEETSLHGSILYTKTKSYLQNNSFSSVSANSQGSVILHSSEKVELYIKPRFEFVCKTGETITRSYNHREGKTEFSLLMLVCKPCPSGEYSLETERLLMNISHAEVITNVKCKACPQGGVCENGVRSLANFWGWKTKDKKKIQFRSCPTSTYCCSDKHCPTYNSCALYREGRLCGQCIQGYSESLFASICIPNESCIGNLVWPFFVLVGFSYVFVLLYFKDIFSYIKLFILKPIVFLQRLKTTNQTTELDELDNLYVVLGEADSPTEEVIIRHDMPPDILPPDICLETNDEASMINPDDDVLEESQEFVCNYYASDDQGEINATTRTELLINCDNGKTSLRSNRKKIKWYSYLFGIFKIIVFFYQMQLLSKIPSVLESSYEFKGPQFLKEFVTGIFNLKMTNSFLNFCLIKDTGPIFKRYIKNFFVLSLFIILFCFYMTCKLVMQVHRILTGSCMHGQETYKKGEKRRLPLSIRVKCCILQLLLLSYSTISTTTFELIFCIQINDVSNVKMYSYINANEECKGAWYIFAKFLVGFWSIPFFIAVFGANKLLRDKRIHVNEFLIILFLPPTLLYFMIRSFLRRYERIDFTAAEIQTREHVLQILEMPFQKKNANKSVWYWETMLILRRLILVCIYVFLPEPIPRLYVMCLPLTLFLVDHLRVQPYNSRLLNWLETASLLCLVFLVSINLFWAYNFETNVPISAALGLISHVFLYVETIILLLPLIIIGFVIIYAVFSGIFRKLRYRKTV